MDVVEAGSDRVGHKVEVLFGGCQWRREAQCRPHGSDEHAVPAHCLHQLAGQPRCVSELAGIEFEGSHDSGSPAGVVDVWMVGERIEPLGQRALQLQ